jgi:hypothetical protein
MYLAPDARQFVLDAFLGQAEIGAHQWFACFRQERPLNCIGTLSADDVD